MAADQLTLKRIDEAHPLIREILRCAYLYVNNHLLTSKYVRLRFSHVHRTPEQQNEEYAKGRTVKGPIVTYAKAWESIHQYNLAFDIVLLLDKDKNGTFETASWDTKYDGDGDGMADWIEITRYFQSIGFTNGFIKNGKKWDLPHFQMDFGLSAKKMKALLDAGKYTTEIVNGRTLKYITI